MNIPKLNSSDLSKFMTEYNNLTSKNGKKSVEIKKTSADSFEYSNVDELSEMQPDASGKYSEAAFFKKGYEGCRKSVSDNGQTQAAYIREGKDPAQSDEEQEVQNGQEGSKGDQTGSSGRVGINAGKLARMLASAKTRSQVQAVIAKIQADLRECETGKNQGMDVDEASVKAAEQLLQQANSRMGSAENREATPEEEMAAALAALM